MMNCPACGGAQAVHETQALYCTNDGRERAVGSVTGHFCQLCGKALPEQQEGSDAERQESRATEPAVVLTAEERAARRQALRNLMGLNKRHREGGPVDGLAFQLEQRAEW